jgi:predicted PolB exonuclease-like 3'-5' exonuclease
MEENSEKICKIQKKSMLNSEDMENKEEHCKKTGKIPKKSKLNGEKIWKIYKKIVKRYGKYRRKL